MWNSLVQYRVHLRFPVRLKDKPSSLKQQTLSPSNPEIELENTMGGDTSDSFNIMVRVPSIKIQLKLY